MFPVFDLINTTNDKSLTRSEKKQLLTNLHSLKIETHAIIFSIIRRFYLINRTNDSNLFEVAYQGKIINNTKKREDNEEHIINDFEFDIEHLPSRLCRMLIEFVKLEKK